MDDKVKEALKKSFGVVNKVRSGSAVEPDTSVEGAVANIDGVRTSHADLLKGIRQSEAKLKKLSQQLKSGKDPKKKNWKDNLELNLKKHETPEEKKKKDKEKKKAESQAKQQPDTPALTLKDIAPLNELYKELTKRVNSHNTFLELVSNQIKSLNEVWEDCSFDESQAHLAVYATTLSEQAAEQKRALDTMFAHLEKSTPESKDSAAAALKQFSELQMNNEKLDLIWGKLTTAYSAQLSKTYSTTKLQSMNDNDIHAAKDALTNAYSVLEKQSLPHTRAGWSTTDPYFQEDHRKFAAKLKGLLPPLAEPLDLLRTAATEREKQAVTRAVSEKDSNVSTAWDKIRFQVLKTKSLAAMALHKHKEFQESLASYETASPHTVTPAVEKQIQRLNFMIQEYGEWAEDLKYFLEQIERQQTWFQQLYINADRLSPEMAQNLLELATAIEIQQTLVRDLYKQAESNSFQLDESTRAMRAQLDKLCFDVAKLENLFNDMLAQQA
jgi:hypothetical protein